MSWPSRVIYIAIALALAFSLVAIAAPRTDADPGLTKWTKVTTPSEVNKTIFPASNLYDFAVGPDGETIYVIGTNGKDLDGDGIFDPALWKSTDGGATWADKTSKIQVWDATAGAWDIKAKLALPAAFAPFLNGIFHMKVILCSHVYCNRVEIAPIEVRVIGMNVDCMNFTG